MQSEHIQVPVSERESSLLVVYILGGFRPNINVSSKSVADNQCFSILCVFLGKIAIIRVDYRMGTPGTCPGALSQSFCVKSLLVTFNVALSKQSVEKYKNSSENSNSRPINTE